MIYFSIKLSLFVFIDNESSFFLLLIKMARKIKNLNNSIEIQINLRFVI
jgi:hypothetical protein